ncbi:TPA: glycosyltransferase [Vibrio harveyi]|nr:glycosyltransferase [Vibrio harveyi]
MRVLVNGAAAKTGGALRVVDSYCKSIANDGCCYVVISPAQPKVIASNIQWVKFETNGIFTFMYSVFFVTLHALKYRCGKIISFTNINSIFPFFQRVTYFHNILIVRGKGKKNYLLKLAVKYLFQKNSKFVFQTKYVKDEFCKYLFHPQDSVVLWPGVDRIKSADQVLKKVKDDVFFGKYIAVPIQDITLEHKNFSQVIDLAQITPNVKYKITSHLPHDIITPNNVEFIGELNQDDMWSFLYNAEKTLISSKDETVCLPIFESIMVGTPVLIYKRPYIESILESFPQLSNGIKFYEDVDNCRDVITEFFFVGDCGEDYYKSNWKL